MKIIVTTLRQRLAIAAGAVFFHFPINFAQDEFPCRDRV